MAESILVTGKKISSMELVTNVTGNEKIPTGQPDDLALTPNQIADHTIARGDLASQEDLSQVEVSLGTQITDLANDVNSSDNSIRGLIAAEEAARIAGDNNLQDAIGDESVARANADTELQSNLDDEVAARIAADALKVDKEGSVSSVAGRVGDVVLTPSDVLVDGFGSQDTVNRYVAKPFWGGLTYDSGERVVLANGDIVKSTIDGNTNDPNADMTGWVKENSASQIFDEGGKNQQEINNQAIQTWFSKVGGWAVNDTVRLNNGDIVVNTVSGNTTNPNTNRTGWVSFGNSNIVFHGNMEYPEYSPFSYMTVNSVPISRKYDMRNYYSEKPENFDWDVHGVRAWLDRYGVMQHNLDVTRFDVASKAANVVNYFVKKGGDVTSLTTGLDPAQPLGAIYAAINRINADATQNAVIWITPEVYTDGAVWGVANPIQSNVSVKIWNGSIVEPFADVTDARATITTESTGLVWVSVGSNTYSTTRVAVGAVVDQNVLNKHGDWTLYTKVDDLAACQAQAGTWAQVDSILYVHTLDNRIPDSLCHVYVTKVSGGAATGDYTFYCERVNFYGGERAFYGYSENPTSIETLVFNKCAFKYATNNNFETRGSKYTITNLCDANYGGSDGFNYHTSLVATTKISYHLEVNCVAYQNGKSWSNLVGSNNGSTVHDGCYIARFNTVTFENEGPNIADVGGGKSWLFNCQARDSRNPIVEGTHADFYTSENLMWLDHCDASGSRYGLSAIGNGRIYMRNTNAYARIYQASKLIDWRTSSYTS